MKYKTMRRIIAPVTRLLFRTKIININKFINAPKQAIYICNHYTFFDTAPLITYLFKKEPIATLAKEEAFESNFYKAFLEATNAIPVKRDGKDSVAIMRCIKTLREGKNLLIFPEGTRNKEQNKEILPLKDGVVGLSSKLNVPVIPLMYYRPLKPFRKNYIIVGDPINFYDIKKTLGENFDYKKANAILRDYMQETRIPMDEKVEGKKVKIKQIESK